MLTIILASVMYYQVANTNKVKMVVSPQPTNTVRVVSAPVTNGLIVIFHGDKRK